VQITLQTLSNASSSSYRWSDIFIETMSFTSNRHMFDPSCFGFVLKGIFKIYFQKLFNVFEVEGDNNGDSLD